jgi:hypothetical protein
VATAFDILTGCGGWSATPGNYSSLRSVQFAPDGSGQVVYGYGQTIYAVVAFRFRVVKPDRLEFEYLESPGVQRFQGFRPDDTNHRKIVRLTLTKEENEFDEDVTGQRHRFRWRLDLSASPYPEGLNFPYSVPTTFYGYAERSEE